MNRETAGLLKASGGRYRPIVIVVHEGIFMANDAFHSIERAMDFAVFAIKEGQYTSWHFHKIEDC